MKEKKRTKSGDEQPKSITKHREGWGSLNDQGQWPQKSTETGGAQKITQLVCGVPKW